MNQACYQYCYPFVQCRAREHFEGDTAVGGAIVVPYRALPVPGNRGSWDLPDAFDSGWEEWLGCSECGTVRSYSASDIRWRTMEKPDLADYPAPGNFYSVHAGCEAAECDEKLTFFVDMKSAGGEELEGKLKRGFFYGMWICGHRLRPAKDGVLVRRIATLPSRKRSNANRVPVTFP